MFEDNLERKKNDSELGSRFDESFFNGLKEDVENGKVKLLILKKFFLDGKITQDQFFELLEVKDKIEKNRWEIIVARLKIIVEDVKKKFNTASSELSLAKEENERLKVELEKAGIDGLTGLLRPEAFEPRLKNLIEELKKTEGKRSNELSAIMVARLDINKFKTFNEKPYNHIVGDAALKRFAKRLVDSTKKDQDILFRMGGDEFLIIMPMRNNNVEFEKIFEDLKVRINNDLFITVDGANLYFTSSMGYSVSTKDKPGTVESLSAEADDMERADKERNTSN